MQLLDESQVVWRFDPEAEAAYTVKPGEVFGVRTRDALNGTVKRSGWQRDPTGRANPATGPIAISGAQPDDVLAIDILDIDPLGDGYVTHGGEPRFFSAAGGLISLGHDVQLRPAPMIGTIGVMPAQGGFSTKVADRHGGNMDTRDVCAGSTLYLRVQRPGGLLALGDVHTLQADGESAGQGIETAAQVTLRARLLPEPLTDHPYLLKGEVLMVIVSAETLDKAARTAVEATASLLAAQSALSYHEARVFLSLAGDVRVGQMVCEHKTVRVAFPLAAVPWRSPLLL